MQVLFVRKGIISAVKTVEFVSDKMSYIILRGRRCHIIVLNVHAPGEDKTDAEDRFYEELERVYDKFPEYHTKILLGDFIAKVSKENIFKPTVENESLHEINDDNGVRGINFATSKNLSVRSTKVSHRNIHKFTWTSNGMTQHSTRKTGRRRRM
jgi:hypothetical protein